MEKQFILSNKYQYLIIGILVLLGLYLSSLYHYLLFHSLAEIFSIVVACGIFMIAWNSRRFLDNNYLLFLGIAYLFVAATDLIHTLAYKGMGVFQGYETNLPTQLWIAARYLESITLLIAPLFLGRKLKINFVFLGYTLATSLLFLSIFYWDIFPTCFIEGVGLTPFKKTSEYIISLILLASIALLLKNRAEFDRNVLEWIVWSITLTIFSELAFTFYIHAYGFSNLVGHYFKIVSFYLLYKALIETGLSRPYGLLFRNLTKSEEALRLSLEESKRRQAEISSLLEALEHSEERYRSVAQTANDAIISADSQGNIVFWNKAAESIFGYSFDEVIGKPLLFIIPERLREAHQKAIDRMISTGKSNIIGKTVEMAGLRRDGSEFPVEISLASWQNREGIFSTGILRDITERKKAEEALRKSRDELELRVQERTAELAKTNQALQIKIEERNQVESALRESETKYRTVADNTYDWIWWLSPEGRFIYVSPSCKRITGQDPEEFLKDPNLLFRIIHFEDKPIFMNHQNEVDSKQTGGEVEFRIFRPDGSNRWIAHACRPVFDDHGNFLGHRGSNRDITERKQAEELLRQSEVQLRYLSSQLLSAEEKERKRISREIHDGIGQSLTAIKFRVENTLQQMNKGNAKRIAEPLETIIPLIQQSIEESRRIQMDLRPSILDDLGILATLSWFCREFQTTYSGISIEKLIDIKEDEVPDSLKTVIYRISQEALNNVAKHSKADIVHLALRKPDGKIELAIRDNGQGFDLKKVYPREGFERGLGLTSMRERTELSGGTFKIESTIGKGTTIRASWTT